MNNKFLDWWVPIHFLVGFCMHPIPRDYAYPLFVSYEIVENLFLTGIIFDEIEGPVNITSDLLFDFVGYELGKKYGKTKI